MVPTKLWCPSCEKPLDAGPEVKVNFNLHMTNLDPEGELDLSPLNCYMDYWHLECGTKMRLNKAAFWEEAVFQYVPHLDMVEIDNDLTGVHQVLHDDFDEVWYDTYVTLFELLDEAVSKARLRS